MPVRRRPRAVRRGGALLIALGLLALGGALLAGSAEAGRSSARSVQSHEAALVASAESRAAVAEFMAGWGPSADSLPIGTDLIATVGPRPRGTGAAIATTRVRLHRLSATRYVIAADCQIGPDEAVLSRRRLQVLLERSTPPDSTGATPPPTPIGRWSMSDLF